MNAERDDALLRVAAAVADGTAVPWDVERSSHPHCAALLEELRLVEALARAQRAVALEVASVPPGAVRDGPPSSVVSENACAGGAVRADVIPSTWGPLRLLGRIGAGTFGEVYRAYDRALQREVALKLLAPRTAGDARADRFLAEARRLARVRHRNVLVVHGADEHDGRVGMWTDLVRGQTLEEYLQRHGPLGPREAAAIGIDVCQALAAVHAEGLLHRDVKTTNVMREEGGRIVLMDFGSVADVAAGEAQGDHLYGTPVAMAPEQLRGETAGAATDVYGVGVLLYRLMSGRFPVEAATLPELMAKHREGASVPLRDWRPDLPGDVVGVVEKALDPDPERRYRTAGGLEKALVETLAAGPGLDVARARRTRLLRWAAALGILVGLAAGVSLVVRTGESARTREDAFSRNPLANESLQLGDNYFEHRSDPWSLMESIRHFREAVSHDPEFALGHAMLSLALSEFYGHQKSRATEDDRVRAREAADRALALAPDLPEAHAALGAYFFHCEERAYARARTEFEIALRGRPGDAVLVAELGYVERRMGLWKEATARLQRASDLDPKDHSIALEAALLYTRMRDYDAAERYFDRTISADPGWFEPYVSKASMLLLRDGSAREAWRVLRVAQRDVRPEGTGDVRNAMRECLVMDGDYATALAHTNAPSFLERAEIHAFLGHEAWSRAYYDSARAYWQRQLEASPYDGTVHAMLGIAYAGLGMAKEAIQEGKVAVDLRPVENDPMYGPGAIENLARIYMMVGDLDAAVVRLGDLLGMPWPLSKEYLRVHPRWAPLRGHRRFEELTRRRR